MILIAGIAIILAFVLFILGMRAIARAEWRRAHHDRNLY